MGPGRKLVPDMRSTSKALAAFGLAGLAAAAITGSTSATAATSSPTRSTAARHVLLLSVDGLHQSDLAYYVRQHPTSELARLVHGGVEYTEARTTFPSDSFPGMVAQVTGARPATSGVFYDDTFSHGVLPAGTVDCSTASAGAEVAWTEAADRSQNPIALDAGQGIAAPTLKALPANTLAQTLAAAPALTRAILQMTPTPQALLDPSALPVSPITCLPIYPHSYLRVNTIFEVARAHGLRTAWSDKHAAYEILSGPSGTGVEDLFTPEINSIADAAGDDWTKDNALTEEYDSFKVAAVLNEIRGKDHSGTRSVGTPAIFGMNFQTVSTAEKLPVSDGLAGGYLPDGAPGALISRALTYVNNQVAAMEGAIDARGLEKSTTIILSAKHGQSPEDLSSLRRVDDGPIIAGIDAGWTAQHPTAPALVDFATDDDGMLLWLSDRSSAAEAYVRTYLQSHPAPANRAGDPKGTTSTTVSSSGLKAVYVGAGADHFLGAAKGDPRVPDVLGIAQHGVVYTGGVAKIAEHGGDDPADRDVPLVISGADTPTGVTINSVVQTAQIAPTILRLLGLNPWELRGAVLDGTRALPVL